ncbi:MAG: hypothetical protein SWX82_00875 [Cyanobacteriota bacterium]|nr:hypothetical protein [Cyanobacteriota bacterium]
MEIVKQTEKELVLKDSLSSRLFGLLFFAPFIALPLFFVSTILSEMGVIKVSCQRVEPTQVNCQVNSSKYLGFIQGYSTSLNRVKEAKFNSRKRVDSDGDTYFDYFVTLVSQTGKEVVSLPDDSYPQEMIEMGVKINKFINYSTEPSLLIQYDLRRKNLLPLAINITLIAIEILIVAVLYLRTVILDKSERQLTYQESSLLGTYTKHYSFAQIKEFILENSTDIDGDQSRKLKIVLPAENQNDRREVTLIKGFEIEEIKKLANTVADFIEIPYQDLSSE